MTDAENDFRMELGEIAIETRERIKRAITDYMKTTGREEADREWVSAIFLASLGSVSDLIKYGEQGPGATSRLYQALNAKV